MTQPQLRWSNVEMMTRKKQQRKKSVIHRYIIDNEKESDQDNLNKEIEEFPDVTTPADMEECLNDEYDYQKRKAAANINEGEIHRDTT